MAGPLKRTGLRSSPEDAAFYKRFHDQVIATLRAGGAHDLAAGDLISKGVPSETAERIVTACKQELALIDADQQIESARRKWIFPVIALSFGIFGSVMVWVMMRDGTFSWEILLISLAVIIGISAFVVFRLFIRPGGLHRLPPPPEP